MNIMCIVGWDKGVLNFNIVGCMQEVYSKESGVDSPALVWMQDLLIGGQTPEY